jgi:hypothetical protein
MGLLDRDEKKKVITRACEYASAVRRQGFPLHAFVSLEIGVSVWWKTASELDPTVAMIGEGALDGQKSAIQVLTAKIKSSPVTVSFVYAHEMGHLVFRHYATEEGKALLYGYYTRNEAEASLFALAYLIAVKDGSPVLQAFAHQKVVSAMCSVHSGHTGFHYPEEEQDWDVAMTRKIAKYM